MKNKTYRYLAILIGMTIVISACKTPNPEVQIQIDSEHFSEPKWGDISAILAPFSNQGMCDIEINDFLFELPSALITRDGRDDDPLFLQHETIDEDIKKLQVWSKKYANDTVVVMFGDMIDFCVVKEVITIFRENNITVRPRTDIEIDPNLIKISLFGAPIWHNQRVDPIVTTPVDEVEAQGTRGHP